MPTSQDQILIMSRALSWYQIDLLKEGDSEAAKKVALLLHELLHNVTIPTGLHDVD